MGMLGSEPDDPIEAMVERARGDSVTETKLTRVGDRVMRQGTLEDRPVVDYLREDEQPHHVLFNSMQEFEFDGEDHEVNNLYWQCLVVTDQRLLVLAGSDDGDTGEVMPYEAVDPYSLDAESDGLTHDELNLVAGGVECEFEVHSKIGIDEIQAAADYVREQAADADRTPERERPRGSVYEIPNLDVAASVWRPDGEDDGEDELDEGDEWERESENDEKDTEGDEEKLEDDELEGSDADHAESLPFDLPDGATAGAAAEDFVAVVFDRKLRVERDERAAEIPLAYVLEVDVDDDEVEFEFGFEGEDGATFEVEHAELEFETDHPAAFERVADEIEARQSGRTGGESGAGSVDDEAVQTLRERYAMGELSTEEYRERLAILQGEDPAEVADSGATEDAPPVVPGGSDAVTTDDVMSGGIPEELQERFDALAELSD